MNLRPEYNKPRWPLKHWKMMERLEARLLSNIPHWNTINLETILKTWMLHQWTGGSSWSFSVPSAGRLRSYIESTAETCSSAAHIQASKWSEIYPILTKALAIFKVKGGYHGWVNLSQSIERMGHSVHIPCITPCGEFYHMAMGRYMLGLVVFVFQNLCPKIFSHCPMFLLIFYLPIFAPVRLGEDDVSVFPYESLKCTSPHKAWALAWISIKVFTISIQRGISWEYWFYNMSYTMILYNMILQLWDISCNIIILYNIIL